MVRRCPVSLNLPDGSRFEGDAPIQSNAKYSPQFVLMGWLRPPERTLEEIVAQLVQERDQHEAECAPWVARLERALETERFNSFWVYEPQPSWFRLGLPADATRAEIGQAFRQAVKEGQYKLRDSWNGPDDDIKGLPNTARIGDLKHHYGWTHAFLKEEFEFHAKVARDSQLFCRRNLPQRRQAAARSSEWFAANHGCWLAIEASQKFLNPTPKKALSRLPAFNHGFDGNWFYNNPDEAFVWLGAVNLDNPAEADWSITPDRQPVPIPPEATELLEAAVTEGTGRFQFSLLDDVDVQNPTEALSAALKAAGLKAAIRSFQQLDRA